MASRQPRPDFPRANLLRGDTTSPLLISVLNLNIMKQNREIGTVPTAIAHTAREQESEGKRDGERERETPFCDPNTALIFKEIFPAPKRKFPPPTSEYTSTDIL